MIAGVEYRRVAKAFLCVMMRPKGCIRRESPVGGRVQLMLIPLSRIRNMSYDEHACLPHNPTVGLQPDSGHIYDVRNSSLCPSDLLLEYCHGTILIHVSLNSSTNARTRGLPESRVRSFATFAIFGSHVIKCRMLVANIFEPISFVNPVLGYAKIWAKDPNYCVSKKY
jgi:hypothetical protein